MSALTTFVLELSLGNHQDPGPKTGLAPTKPVNAGEEVDEDLTGQIIGILGALKPKVARDQRTQILPQTFQGPTLALLGSQQNGREGFNERYRPP